MGKTDRDKHLSLFWKVTVIKQADIVAQQGSHVFCQHLLEEHTLIENTAKLSLIFHVKITAHQTLIWAHHFYKVLVNVFAPITERSKSDYNLTRTLFFKSKSLQNQVT